MAACPICNNIAKIEGHQGLDSYQQIIPAELQASVVAGKCPFCPLLWDANQAIELNVNDQVVTIVLANRLGASASERTLFIKVVCESGRREIFELYTTQGHNSYPSPLQPLKKIKHLRDIPGDTSSQKSLNWTKERLRECNEQHANCSIRRSGPLPSRVLNLGPPGENGNYTQDPKLYVTGGENSAYFCLSYCWGASVPLRLTSSTIDQFQNGISWSTLPKTYQDAIIFTRKMGYQYLWIDSLCIIQDSESDWRTESSKMGTIFMYSALVLAAAMSVDTNGGCFSSVTKYQWHHGLHLKTDRQEFSFRIRRQVKHDTYMSYHNRNHQAPLFYRAWIFQERILAPRVLFFMEGELIFRCLQLTKCECESEWLVHDINWLYDIYPQEDRESKHWHDWVHTYSGLALTYPSDKLPAISGLASEVDMLTKGQLGDYLAGLWRKALFEDLLWYVQDFSRLPAPSERRHPSWSWVAVDSQVSFKVNTPLRVESATILEATTTLKGTDTFGQVTSGTLTLSGHLTKVKLRYFTDGKTPLCEELDWRIYHNFAVGIPDSQNFIGVHMDTQWDTSTADWDVIETDLFELREPVYCLRMGESEIISFSLILRIVDCEEGVYQRVGLLSAQIGQLVHDGLEAEKRTVKIV